MMCMVTVFFVVVVVMGLDFKLLTLGLLPNISGKKSDAVAEFFAGNPWPKGKALESSQSGIAFSTISDHDSSRSNPKSYRQNWGSLRCYWFHRYSLKLNARYATRRISYCRQSLQPVRRGRKLHRKEEIQDKDGYNFIRQPKPRWSPTIASRLFFPGLSKSPHLQHRFLQELLHQDLLDHNLFLHIILCVHLWKERACLAYRSLLQW